jgi:hypothetical protein
MKRERKQQFVVAKVDRDYLDMDGEMPEWTYDHLEEIGWFDDYDTVDFNRRMVADSEKMRFRIRDDDGEVYFGGWLLNDDYALIQAAVLHWATGDSGATEIQVRRNSDEDWRNEIA